MPYMTIILELLQQRPEMRDQLQTNRRLLPTLELYARELKTTHNAWEEVLRQAKPDSDTSQLASEAMEMAIRELEDRLACGSPLEDAEPLSLEKAMAYVQSHTSNG
jgi:hypothetical protein